MENNKYPWVVHVFNRLTKFDPNLVDWKKAALAMRKIHPLNALYYKRCTGTLITGSHVLTSADCVLLDEESVGRPAQVYNDPENIFAIMGVTKLQYEEDTVFDVKNRRPHDLAFAHGNFEDPENRLDGQAYNFGNKYIV